MTSNSPVCVWCEAFCLLYLLRDKRDSSVTDRLRHAKTFELIPATTNSACDTMISLGPVLY